MSEEQQGGGSGETGGQESKPVDLTSPEVQKAIKAAEERVRAEAKEAEAALRKNRDDILDEKKRYTPLGKPDELALKLKRLEELEMKASADKAGINSDQFRAEVEKIAQAKYAAKQQELADLMAADKKSIATLTEENENLKRQAHRDFVARELVKAALPDDARIVQEGAWDYLIDTLAAHTERHTLDGGLDVARFKVNGALVPGGGPDGLMTAREMLEQARSGKGPIQNIGFCFVSGARGSGTRSNDGKPSPTAHGNWFKMTPEEQSAFVREKGPAAAKELIDASESPEHAAATR